MRQGKRPTVEQKKIIKAAGLNYDNWVVVLDTKEKLVIRNRVSEKERTVCKEGKA